MKRFILLILAAILAVGIPMTGSAYAHTSHKSHHHKGQHHTNLTKGNPWLEGLLHDPNVSIGASESGSSSEVILLSEEHIGGAKVNSPRCFTGDGLNSGYTATGEKYWFPDHEMEMCPDPNSETGWVKVGGGETGADCENEVKPHVTAPEPEVEIRWVHSFGRFHAKALAHEEVTVHEWCGKATASASAYASALGVTKAQAKENATFYASGKAKASAHAEAIALLHCSEPKQPTPTPTPTPTPPKHEETPPCTSCHEEEKEPPCECTPPPPCGEVEFFGEYEFEEAYVNEPPIEYWKYINAPKGDKLTVYFETEHASFSPEVVQVASFGAETTKFQSYWTAPSHPGHYAVWVRVVDHTCEKTYESAKQFVTVLPQELEENPR